jgi:hypothetical protein
MALTEPHRPGPRQAGMGLAACSTTLKTQGEYPRIQLRTPTLKFNDKLVQISFSFNCFVLFDNI